tara:strand:- start:764 stop:1126 length:363 start_codon:yes stop_codon:yes gene_type:complete
MSRENKSPRDLTLILSDHIQYALQDRVSVQSCRIVFKSETQIELTGSYLKRTEMSFYTKSFYADHFNATFCTKDKHRHIDGITFNEVLRIMHPYFEPEIETFVEKLEVSEKQVRFEVNYN